MLIPLLLAGSFVVRASQRPLLHHLTSSAPAATSPLTFILIMPPPQFSAAPAPEAAPVAPDAADAAAEEQELANDINAERSERGLTLLSLDPLLGETARAHSREMCSLNYFGHRSPVRSSQTPMTRYLAALRDEGMAIPSAIMVGENVYYCSRFTPDYSIEAAHQALMDSPDHRDNILDSRFDRLGIGIYHDGSGRFWITEMFLQESDAP